MEMGQNCPETGKTWVELPYKCFSGVWVAFPNQETPPKCFSRVLAF